MSRNPANSLLNSIKGKIWIATTAIAFFVCIFGFVSYLLVSFIVSNTIYAVLIPFVLVAISVIFFGWWLSGEVVAPLERLNLAAKTLERSITSSFPSTSGAVETDEILDSLRRIGLQMQKLVVSMEEVMKGNLESVTVLGSADRLNQTFQRLLSRLGESIRAKNEFERLNEEIEELARRITSVRFGADGIELGFHTKKIQEIAANFVILFDDYKNVLQKIERMVSKGYEDASEVKATLISAIEANEKEARQIQQVIGELRKFPNTIRRISDELNHSTEWVKFTVEQVNDRREFIRENIELLSAVISKVQNSIMQLRRMNQNFLEIDNLVKDIQNVSRRMGVLFLSLEVSSFDGFEFIGEVSDLSRKMEGICEQVMTIRQAFQKHVENSCSSLESLVKDVERISELMLEVEEGIEGLQRSVTKFMDLQDRVISFSQEQLQQVERAFQVLVKSTSEAESVFEGLKESSVKLNYLLESIKLLQKPSPRGKLFKEQEENFQ
ncbi:MAG: hypothetical protein N2Z23_01255 [Pyrinomonadaceae bacterium]|nr:hypothetical protein [Pyrinomonadaceae bacterium]MCX7639059.1 hypothetical protein [Pyrinomonadaceae bacterium]MDW8303720.1 hypothetical protein [Acidobacteriota bacterium]